MLAQAQSEHRWFEPFLGKWRFEHECEGVPGQPKTTNTGEAEVTMLGELWALFESRGNSAECGPWRSIMTVGFDPQKGCYVGTFVGSMMTFLWVYQGEMNPNGTALSLRVEGPKFDGSGMTQFNDILEIVDRDHWILRSQMRTDDGQWQEFMVGHHYRVKD